MALKKPLVVSSGQIQQLQAGDTLDAPQSGGDEMLMTNNNAGAVVIGCPVYMVAVDAFDKARANAAGTSRVIGMVAKSPSIANGASGPVRLDGPLTATTPEWDAVTGGSGGLVFNTVYYLDPAAVGKITSTAPTTVGQLVVEIGVGLSTTEMQLNIKSPILL